MHTETLTNPTTIGAQTLAAVPAPCTDVRTQLVSIQEEKKRLDRERLATIALAEQTHVYRKEAARLLGLRADDIAVLRRFGLLGVPIEGYNRQHMFDRQAIQALLDARDALRTAQCR